MGSDPGVPLWEIDKAGASIKCFTEGMDCDAWLRDDRTQAAVERKFEIIGGALSRLQKSHPEHAARIPNLCKIIGLRNVLAHGYDSVMPEDLWNYSHNDLSALRAVVRAMLDELGPSEA